MIDREVLAKAVFGEENPPIPTEAELEKAMATLHEKARFVLERRFTRPFMTLRAIGRIYPRAGGGLGVTPEYIRQREARALRMLRHPSRLGFLNK